MEATDCHFCSTIHQAPQAWAGATAVALPESRPHAQGHTVIVPRRHVSRLADLTDEEHHELWALMRTVASDLQEGQEPDAFTIGVNDGPAAGQSTPHVHLHVVPRHHGDVTDPKGGIRRALPPALRG